MKDYYINQEEKYKPYGLRRKDIDNLHHHLCEIMPSVAEDSGQAEWTTGELDNFILTPIFTLKLGSLHKAVMLEANSRSLKSNKRISMAEVVRNILSQHFKKKAGL